MYFSYKIVFIIAIVEIFYQNFFWRTNNIIMISLSYFNQFRIGIHNIIYRAIVNSGQYLIFNHVDNTNHIFFIGIFLNDKTYIINRIPLVYFMSW